MRTQKLRVRDAANQAESLHYVVVQSVKLAGLFGIARQSARGENAAFVRGVQRRRSVGVRFGESDFALGNDAVDVEHVAGDKLFEQVARLVVAEPLENRPQLVRRAQL